MTSQTQNTVKADNEESNRDLRMNSADQLIESHFTPEQRRNWTEFIAGTDLNNYEDIGSNSMTASLNQKDSVNTCAQDMNSVFTKEERKSLTEYMLQSDDPESNPVQTQELIPTSNDQRNEVEVRKEEVIDSTGSDTKSQIPIDTKQRVDKCRQNLLKQKLIIRKFVANASFGYIAYGSYRNQKQIAIKVIDSVKSGNDVINANMIAFKALKHENIVNLLHLIQEKEVLFLAMPSAECDLFEYINSKGSLDEKRGKDVINQILSAMQFIHSNGLAHKDVKLENILVFGRKVRICDFDLMARANDNIGSSLVGKQVKGTLVYMAPELLAGKGSHDLRLADIWSCGVCAYAVLTRSYPYGPIDEIGSQSEKALKDMKFSRYSYPKQCILSHKCKHFIRNLLEFDPYSRQTSDQLLSDEWFSI